MRAYSLFFSDTQASIKAQNQQASFGEVSRIVATMWESLEPHEKAVLWQNTWYTKWPDTDLCCSLVEIWTCSCVDLCAPYSCFPHTHTIPGVKQLVLGMLLLNCNMVLLHLLVQKVICYFTSLLVKCDALLLDLLFKLKHYFLLWSYNTLCQSW